MAPLFKLLNCFELLVPMVIAGIVDQSPCLREIKGHLWMQIGLLYILQ